MSFWDNVKKFTQPYSDDDYDDYDEDDYLDDYEEPAEPRRERRRSTPAPAPSMPVMEEEEEEEETGSNKFLVFVLVVLILALLAVSGYIAYTKLWKPSQIGSDNNKPQGDAITAEPVDVTTEPTFVLGGEDATVEATVEPTVPTIATEPTIPCTDLSLVASMDTLTFKGQTWRLLVKYAP